MRLLHSDRLHPHRANATVRLYARNSTHSMARVWYEEEVLLPLIETGRLTSDRVSLSLVSTASAATESDLSVSCVCVCVCVCVRVCVRVRACGR